MFEKLKLNKNTFDLGKQFFFIKCQEKDISGLSGIKKNKKINLFFLQTKN